jgi:hypothetical protein
MKTLKPHIFYVDIGDVICDFTSAYNCALQQIPSIKQSQYRFFANLTPKNGAIEAVKVLIQSPAFEPYVLTAPIKVY